MHETCSLLAQFGSAEELQIRVSKCLTLTPRGSGAHPGDRKRNKGEPREKERVRGGKVKGLAERGRERKGQGRGQKGNAKEMQNRV